MQPFYQLLQIAFFRSKPQDLPFNPYYAGFAIVVLIATSYYPLAFANKFSQPFALTLCKISLLAAFIFLILKLNKKDSRFIQSITVIFGIQALLQSIALFIPVQEGASIFTLFIGLWSLAIAIYVLKEALECSISSALFLTLGYQMMIGSLLMFLFPEILQLLQEAQ